MNSLSYPFQTASLASRFLEKLISFISRDTFLLLSFIKLWKPSCSSHLLRSSLSPLSTTHASFMVAYGGQPEVSYPAVMNLLYEL